jgi:hypothetical protein
LSGERHASQEVRRPAARRTRSTPSAGLPADDLATIDRLAELDARLVRLEGGAGYRERGRHLLNRLMPPDASQHFRNAGREDLLGIRSIVDFWIKRIDSADERAAGGHSARESIDVE